MAGSSPELTTSPHGQQGGLLWPIMAYPLVNIQKAIENDNFQWENPHYKWTFSILAMLNYQRVQYI